MNYEVTELLEVGNAGTEIQAQKPRVNDESSGIIGPNFQVLEDE